MGCRVLEQKKNLSGIIIIQWILDEENTKFENEANDFNNGDLVKVNENRIGWYGKHWITRT